MITVIVKCARSRTNGNENVAASIRESMVQHMVLLLARKGLQGASFSEILQASGAPRGSLYHHFPGGKDELVLAALEEARETAYRFLGGLKGRRAVEVVGSVTSWWRGLLVQGNLEAGCAVLAVTVAAETPALLERAGEVFSMWRSQLAELLTAGGVPRARAPRLASLIMSTFEGATALARAEKSLEPFDFAASEVRRVVEEATSKAEIRHPGAGGGRAKRKAKRR